LSKRIRHVHVCAGCGKKRSKRYQKAHPLKRGEAPTRNYCYSCLQDAASTDSETSKAIERVRNQADNVTYPLKGLTMCRSIIERLLCPARVRTRVALSPTASTSTSSPVTVVSG
jgi:hypothetical protein